MSAQPAIKNISLAQNLSSRDTTLQFDALLQNCYPESAIADGGIAAVVRRFGLQASIQFTPGTALGLFTFYGQPITIIGTAIYMGSQALNITVNSSTPYQFVSTLANLGFVVANNTNAYYGQSIATGVTNGSQTVTSAGLFGAVAVGDSVTTLVSGVPNLTFPAGTVVSAVTNSSSITVSHPYSGTTGAADLLFFGPITDANYPPITVPGIAYLDGYIFELDIYGKLWNSQVNTPRTWNALNFIQGASSGGNPVALTGFLNYVMTLFDNQISFFYDNANPVGSPLNNNTGATQNVGCACGTSVVQTRNTVFWVGQTKQRGRSVYNLQNGINPTPVSDTYVDRILNGDTLVGVTAFFIEINGHYLYILNLPSSNYTLVYDMQTNLWHTWTSSIPGTALTSTAGTISDGIVYLTIPNHGLSNGAVVNVTGSTLSQFLGTFLVNVQDANTIYYTAGSNVSGGINTKEINKYAVDAEPIQNPASGGFPTLTVTPWLNNYFRCPYYTFSTANGGTDYLLDQSTGTLYETQEGISNDNGVFIYTSIRTENFDNNNNRHKFVPVLELVGDKFPGDVAYLSFSDNDYQSFIPFRPINIGAGRSQLRRNGRFRRRAHQIIYLGVNQVRFYRLELELNPGKQ